MLKCIATTSTESSRDPTNLHFFRITRSWNSTTWKQIFSYIDGYTSKLCLTLPCRIHVMSCENGEMIGEMSPSNLETYDFNVFPAAPSSQNIQFIHFWIQIWVPPIANPVSTAPHHIPSRPVTRQRPCGNSWRPCRRNGIRFQGAYPGSLAGPRWKPKHVLRNATKKLNQFKGLAKSVNCRLFWGGHVLSMIKHAFFWGDQSLSTTLRRHGCFCYILTL